MYEYADYCKKYVEEHTEYLGRGLMGEMIKPLTNLFAEEKYNKVFTNKLFDITHGSKHQEKKKELMKKYENISEHLYSALMPLKKKMRKRR